MNAITDTIGIDANIELIREFLFEISDIKTIKIAEINIFILLMRKTSSFKERM